MNEEQIDITPNVTVDRLLNVYPHLEDVLIGIAPPFKKLKNPLLRNSVAKVATIRHISSVGRVNLTELVNTLRESVGQSAIESTFEDVEYFTPQPEWFSYEKITLRLDEQKAENPNQMTPLTILQEATVVKKGEIIELQTTFLPASGIDTMKAKGYSVWTKLEGGDIIKTYFLKNSD